MPAQPSSPGHHAGAVRTLTEGELQATVSAGPRPCGVADEMWQLLEAYADALPDEQWQGHRPAPRGTPTAWAMRGGRWVHVLLATLERRVAMVVVLDVKDRVVHGHRLLDLG